jgi:hypothetical protein
MSQAAKTWVEVPERPPDTSGARQGHLPSRPNVENAETSRTHADDLADTD